MSLFGPSISISDEQFLMLINYDIELWDLFLQSVEPQEIAPADTLRIRWGSFWSHPSWTKYYSTVTIQRKMKQISAQAQFIGLFNHALGRIGSFPSDPLHTISPKIEEILQSKYPRTISSLLMKQKNVAITPLAYGYYNIPFQQSLLSALKDFQQFSPDPLYVLPQTIDIIEKSLAYYLPFSPPSHKSPSAAMYFDLLRGTIRVFSTGRNSLEDFHATSIVISAKYIAFCDRFDVNSVILIDNKPHLTSRDFHHGIYVYQLPCPFARLPIDNQIKLMHFLIHSISREDAFIGIQKLLGFADNPLLSLSAKKQKRGNCRYASKKQGIGGAMLLVALEQLREGELTEDRMQHIKKEITHLHKSFKLYDRSHKINLLIENEELCSAQKDQLMLSALFRMKSPNKRYLIEKIAVYFKNRIIQSPHVRVQLRELFHQLAVSLQKDEYFRYIEPIKNCLQAHLGELNPKKPSHYMPQYHTRKRKTSNAKNQPILTAKKQLLLTYIKK